MASKGDDYKHQRRCLLDFFRSGHSKHDSANFMEEQFGDKAPHRNTISKWWARFEAGDESIEDLPRSGRPLEFDPSIALRALQDDPGSSLRDLERTLGGHHETIRRSLKASGMEPKKPTIVPHDLTPQQKKTRVDICSSNLLHPHPRKLLESMLCQDEKWLFYSNPNHNPVWVPFDEPAPTVAKRDVHGRKQLVSFWFSRHGPVHCELLPINSTITADSLSSELETVVRKAAQLNENLKNPVLLWDNARPHKAKHTRETLERLSIEELPHPPYSPDLSPCDYHIFRSLQDFLIGRQLKDSDDVQSALNEWIQSRPAKFWKDGVDSLPNRWRTVVASHGEYIINL